MDINEAFRRIVAGHLRIIGAFVVVAVLVVLAWAGTSNHGYIASARIQASTTSIGSDTEADALLNRVTGVASSTAIVGQALQTAKLDNRSAQDVAREVTVSRLGSSAVMDIAVTDHDPRFASALASSLATTVVNFIGAQGTPQQQDLVNRLTAEQNQLYTQRAQLVATLSQATGTLTVANLSPLTALDQQLSDLSSTLGQLQVAIVTGSSASVISLADPAKPVPSGFATKLVLALVAGLVAGLLTAAVREVVRPRVADAEAFARELNVPLLGRIAAPAPHTAPRLRTRPRGTTPPGTGPEQSRPVLDDATIVAVRRAAARAGAQTLVLLDDDERPRVPVVADHLTAALRLPGHDPTGPNGYSPEPMSGVADGAADGGATTLLRPMIQKLRDRTADTGLRVVPMSALAGTAPPGGCALLALVPRLTSYAYLRRVGDVAAATGWPVAGVLDAPLHGGKGRS